MQFVINQLHRDFFSARQEELHPVRRHLPGRREAARVHAEGVYSPKHQRNAGLKIPDQKGGRPGY